MRGMFKRKHKDFTEQIQSKSSLSLFERIMFDKISSGSTRKKKSYRQDDFSAEHDFDSRRDANSSTRQLSSNRVERKIRRRAFKKDPDLDAT
jgi:REP element-mobilizing transposase RayT